MAVVQHQRDGVSFGGHHDRGCHQIAAVAVVAVRAQIVVGPGVGVTVLVGEGVAVVGAIGVEVLSPSAEGEEVFEQRGESCYRLAVVDGRHRLQRDGAVDVAHGEGHGVGALGVVNQAVDRAGKGAYRVITIILIHVCHLLHHRGQPGFHHRAVPSEDCVRVILEAMGEVELMLHRVARAHRDVLSIPIALRHTVADDVHAPHTKESHDVCCIGFLHTESHIHRLSGIGREVDLIGVAACGSDVQQGVIVGKVLAQPRAHQHPQVHRRTHTARSERETHISCVGRQRQCWGDQHAAVGRRVGRGGDEGGIREAVAVIRVQLPE